MLKIQQTAFENECRLLLSGITKEQDELFSNPAHNGWHDQDLARRFSAYLNNSVETCLSTITLIDTALTNILEETQGGFHDLQRPRVRTLH